MSWWQEVPDHVPVTLTGRELRDLVSQAAGDSLDLVGSTEAMQVLGIEDPREMRRMAERWERDRLANVPVPVRVYRDRPGAHYRYVERDLYAHARREPPRVMDGGEGGVDELDALVAPLLARHRQAEASSGPCPTKHGATRQANVA